MANIAFPDGSSAPFFNPAAHQGAAGEVETRKAKGGGKNRKAAAKSGFTSFFEKIVLGNVKELPLSEDSLHELLDEVHNAGDVLSNRPFPPEIAAYKEAVRNFVHYVVEHSFDTEEQMGRLDMVKRKKYTVVKVIDSKLEGMATAILRDQITQLEILEKLEEIKGLLVDLMQ